MSISFQTFLQQKGNITEEEFTLLQPYITYKEYEAGSYLLRPGEIATTVHFVEKGLIRMYSVDDHGKEHILHFAPESWYVCDRSSYFLHSPSTIFIQTIEPTRTAIFTQAFYDKAYQLSPSFQNFNELALQRHIHSQQLRIMELLSANAEQRYLSFVKTYPDVMLRVPQWMIASFLGIAPESLSRVRKELARQHFKQ